MQIFLIGLHKSSPNPHLRQTCHECRQGYKIDIPPQKRSVGAGVIVIDFRTIRDFISGGKKLQRFVQSSHADTYQVQAEK